MILIVAIASGLFVGVLAVEAFLAMRNAPAPFANPAINPTIYGDGQALSYLILGDSTAAGQGGDYSVGIATASAKHLATTRKVSLTNLGVSGAKTHDILEQQISGIKNKPDIVLVSVGANDVTGLTSAAKIGADLNNIIDAILQKNCDAKIVITASPDLGTATRLWQPLRYIGGVRARQLNKTFHDVVSKRQLTLAPILEITGPQFAANPSLLGPDKFHPNNDGYKVWADVINPALDQALADQPSHCGG